MLARLLDAASKFTFFGVQFERRKVDKKSKPTQKLKHAHSILEYCEHFCHMTSKSIPIISSYTVSKFRRFFVTQCTTTGVANKFHIIRLFHK